MAGNNGGPWGGGGNRGDDGRGSDDRGNGGRRPGQGPEGPQIPEIDELMKKGQEQLRVLMGGRGGNGSGTGGGRGGPSGPSLNRTTISFGVIAAVVAWGLASLYTVRPEEQSVELFLGEFSSIGNPGLNFAPWPLVTKEVIPVTSEQTIEIGQGSRGGEAGLMLTGDEKDRKSVV